MLSWRPFSSLIRYNVELSIIQTRRSPVCCWWDYWQVHCWNSGFTLAPWRGRPFGSLSSHVYASFVVYVCEGGVLVSEELLHRFPFYLSRGFTKFKSLLALVIQQLQDSFFLQSKQFPTQKKWLFCNSRNTFNNTGEGVLTKHCCSVKKEVIKISFQQADKAVNSHPHLILYRLYILPFFEFSLLRCNRMQMHVYLSKESCSKIAN